MAPIFFYHCEIAKSLQWILNLFFHAPKIINKINKPYQLADNILSIGVSIGISFYPDDADTTKTLNKLSDIALYSAKNKGRNQYQLSVN